MVDRDLFGKPEVQTQPPDAAPTGVRRERDSYYSPDALALACARELAERITAEADIGNIIEPGCGGGAFLRASRSAFPRARVILGVDLWPACESCHDFMVETRDAFDPALPTNWSLAIGNPPYDLAEKFVRRSLELVEPEGFVAMLLRITFLASRGRVPLYREHPLWAFWPIAGRPSFTGGGSDVSEYGFFVWRRGWKSAGRIYPPVDWKK